MRVLVLVLACAREPWLTIERRGSRETWGATAVPDVSIKYYYGLHRGPTYWSTTLGARMLRALGVGESYLRFQDRVGSWSSRRAVEIEGSNIRTRVPESYLHTNAKLRAALRSVLARDSFDYLLRTNVTSYVECKRLASWVAELPGAGYYGGFLGERDGVPYVSGAGILMSRDVVELAARDRLWEFDRVDDVALGRAMWRAGIEPRFVPRLEVSSRDAELDLDELRRCFLVRCRRERSDVRTRRQLRKEVEENVAMMHRVHRAYQSLG